MEEEKNPANRKSGKNNVGRARRVNPTNAS